jgi:hypothetical protein
VRTFPRAILFGPYELGGMAIPNTISETTITRINYFLYHMQQETDIGVKLDASLTFLQLEVGIFSPLLESLYQTYGHHITRTLISKI